MKRIATLLREIAAEQLLFWAALVAPKTDRGWLVLEAAHAAFGELTKRDAKEPRR